MRKIFIKEQEISLIDAIGFSDSCSLLIEMNLDTDLTLLVIRLM